MMRSIPLIQEIYENIAFVQLKLGYLTGRVLEWFRAFINFVLVSFTQN